MKTILKAFLIAGAAAGLTSTAVAGERLRNISEFIEASGGSVSNGELQASRQCFENPASEGAPRAVVRTAIVGTIANNEVAAFDFIEGDSCPDNVNLAVGGNQSLTISVDGHVVTADCTGQATSSSKFTQHIKIPDQAKPLKVSVRSVSSFDYGPSFTACVITASHSGGATEMFDSSSRLARLDTSYTLQKIR